MALSDKAKAELDAVRTEQLGQAARWAWRSRPRAKVGELKKDGTVRAPIGSRTRVQAPAGAEGLARRVDALEVILGDLRRGLLEAQSELAATKAELAASRAELTAIAETLTARGF